MSGMGTALRTLRIGIMAAVALAAALVATMSLAPRAEAFIYWSADSENIGRADLDGTVTDPVFLRNEDNGGASDLAVNGDYIYWIGPFFGEAIGRASLDRNDINYEFISFPAPSPGVENVTVAGGHIYWTSQLTESIGRANLDGTGVDHNFMPLDPGNPDGRVRDAAADVAVDGGHIFWTRAHGDYSEPGGIGRANLDGSGVDPNFIATGPGRYPFSLAVDGGHIYWTEFERFDVNPTIGRANLDGSGVNSNLISLPAPSGDMAIDAGHIYWVQGSTPPTIARANLDGTGAEGSFIPQSALGGIGGFSGLAVDSLTSEIAACDAEKKAVKKAKKKVKKADTPEAKKNAKKKLKKAKKKLKKCQAGSQ